MRIQRNSHQLALIGNGLDLFCREELQAVRIPTPDTATGSPNFNAVGVLTEPTTDCLTKLPRTVNLIAPWMAVFGDL